MKDLKIDQILQAKFTRFMEFFRNASFTRPEFKAIRDITTGTLASGSAIVLQIAKALQESISLDKTTERLYRNLKRSTFAEKIQSTLVEHQCRTFNESTLIIIDESDISKNHAKKMEGISPVRDGSKHIGAQGYNLLNILACQASDKALQLRPVSSDLISPKCDPDTVHNYLEDRINDITVHSGNKGIFLFDRGFDSRKVFRVLIGNQNSFIIRSMEKRDLYLQGARTSFKKVRNHVPLNYVIPAQGKIKEMHCGCQSVGIRMSDHDTQDPPLHEVWLVTARYGATGGRFSFLCQFPGRNLTESEIVNIVMNAYRIRWKIEEVHRQIKQDYGWEEMQLLSYTGLKNLNALLWVTLAFLYTTQDNIIQIVTAFPRMFSKKWKNNFLKKGFVFYCLSEVMKKVFEPWKRRNDDPYKGEYRRRGQLVLKFEI